jgi:cytochrome P450
MARTAAGDLKAFARAYKVYARARREAGSQTGVALPPGALNLFDNRAWHDQRHMLRQSRRLGPIFKMLWKRHYFTCVTGHERARRLLQGHGGHLPGASIKIGDLVPHGILRNMADGAHARYRPVFARAFAPGLAGAWQPALSKFLETELTALASSSQAGPFCGGPLIRHLSRIATGLLLPVVFGTPPQSDGFVRLAAAYHRLGPIAPVWHREAEQHAAFAELSGIVAQLIEQYRRQAPDLPCVLGHLVQAGETDRTITGNLIYMTELGRFDLACLLRWCLYYLAQAPALHDAIRDQAQNGPTPPSRLAVACVFETLRLNQLEGLERRVTKSFAFEGFWFPKGSYLRICLWEGHRDPAVFPQPDQFDPGRMLNGKFAQEAFAPFGLGNRACIAAEPVPQLAGLVLERLMAGFRLTAEGVGQPVRSQFHWEPPPGFAIRLEPLPAR